MSIGALNEITTISKYAITTTLKSLHNGYQKILECLVVPVITSFTPDQQIDRKRVNIPSNLQLADPEFHIPAPIHLLLSAGVALSCLCVGQIKLSSLYEPELILQKTQLGWILGGCLPHYRTQKQKAQCQLLHLDDDISRFWEIEEVTLSKHLSEEEALCENHFKNHVKRARDGRYIIALPFNGKRESLGQSYHTALKRLQALERRFLKNPKLQEQYIAVLREYLDLGYMSRVSDSHFDGFFLPHQAVLKETSMTTKVRVVFDASSESNTGISLNDALLAGPTIQDDIFSLLLRFRLHNHVLTGDIEKMYLQILVREEDQPFLRILWKDDDGSLSTYQFNRLIFGL